MPEQAKVNRHLIPWAKEFGLKLVATNDVHYVEKEPFARARLPDLHRHADAVDRHQADAATPEQFYLRSAEEMKARFAETPEAVQNTLEVAEKCNLEIEFGKLHYPVFHPPEHFTREGYLRQLLAEGLRSATAFTRGPKGQEFVVEGIEDPTRLPTYQPVRRRSPTASEARNSTATAEPLDPDRRGRRRQSRH